MTTTKTRNQTLPVKVAVVILAGVVTLALGVAAAIAAIGPLLTAAVLACCLIAAHFKARSSVHAQSRWVHLTNAQRDRLVRNLIGAGIIHAVWITTVTSDVMTAWWWVCGIVALPALAWAEWLRASYLDHDLVTESEAERKRNHKPHDDTNPGALVSTNAPAGSWEHKAMRFFRHVLAVTKDYSYLQVTSAYRRNADCMVITVRVPSKLYSELFGAETNPLADLAPVAASGKKTAPKKSDARVPFGPDCAEDLAIAISELLNKATPTHFVEITKLSDEGAGLFDVVILTRDIMADAIAFEDDNSPITLDTPVEFGFHMDGTPAELRLRGCGRIVAKSQSGKTNLLMNFILHLLRCTDTEVWFAGRRKMFETLSQLLLKYLDTDEELPLVIASGQADTLRMLQAALNVMEHAQNLLPHERAMLKEIVLIIDEATDIFSDDTIRFSYQNRMIDASEAFEMLQRGGKSAGISLIVVTHRDVNHSLGDEGGDIKAGFDWEMVLMTNDDMLVGRVFGHYGLPKLKNPGEVYYAYSGHNPRRAKVKYIAEVGKRGAPVTNGITVPEAGWNRRVHTHHRHLSPDVQRAAGEFYARRHRRFDAALMDYLRYGPPPAPSKAAALGAAVATAPALEPGPDGLATALTPEEAGKARAEALIAAVRSMGAAPAAIAEAPVETMPPVTTLKGRGPTMLTRVHSLLAERGPMTSREIFETLRAEELRVTGQIKLDNIQLVHNALNTLCGKEQVSRNEETRQYVAA